MVLDPSPPPLDGMHVFQYIYIYMYVHKYTHVNHTYSSLWTLMPVSTEIATHPKSTTSRNSDFLVSCRTKSNSDFGSVWIWTVTKEFEFLDLVDFGGVACSVESVIVQENWRYRTLSKLETLFHVTNVTTVPNVTVASDRSSRVCDSTMCFEHTHTYTCTHARARAHTYTNTHSNT